MVHSLPYRKGDRGVNASSNGGSRLRFVQFELDRSHEKLLKRGLPVRLENKPFQILAALLEHPGEVISRKELCTSLWSDGTYVDFDEGLNTAIMKLRFALGDAAENPVFIETVPRRGYRFIAPVQIAPLENGPSPPAEAPPASPGPSPGSLVLPTSDSTPKWRAARLITLGLVVAGACWSGYRLAFPRAPRITQITRLTNSGHVDP